MVDNDSKLIKLATNEWALMAWRTTMAVGMAVATWLVNDIRSGQDKSNVEIAKLAAQFNDFRLTNEARIGKVEGEVGLLRGSVEVHRSRLDGADADRRSLWGRLYDLSKAQQQRGNP